MKLDYFPDHRHYTPFLRRRLAQMPPVDGLELPAVDATEEEKASLRARNFYRLADVDPFFAALRAAKAAECHPLI